LNALKKLKIDSDRKKSLVLRKVYFEVLMNYHCHFHQDHWVEIYEKVELLLMDNDCLTFSMLIRKL